MDPNDQPRSRPDPPCGHDHERILAAAAIIIPIVREQAQRAQRQWQDEGKAVMDDAARRMEALNADLERATASLRRDVDAVVARVRKDLGR